ncbi:sodium:proton antiporter [Bermanella marisrubri]|uniref:Potassium-efflux system protein n=1 Tax=Bermanella marisrubri TaxID=207949 RepID=Q1N562_9GAMM|nr:cation:proton antiporter [Bermanella marisrubri]EAT13216.1 potassium-efflux system protein [Oceanobacter sp. RED65] [Bermanella marisrubri]QIZ83984.1 sodium:proton antiporter [Bermanella marisrubri]
MPHEIGLITILAAGFGLALVLGFIVQRLGLPTLVGYLLAGIVIGPHTPGFTADIGLAGQLAEIGVMLLMFGVGLHFSLNDLLSVKRIAVPGAIVQILVALSMGMGLAIAWGWSIGEAIVFGFCLSVASTVVLLRALESGGILNSMNGRIAVGWLVVEDLVMVLLLVLLPAFAAPVAEGESLNLVSVSQVVGITLLKVAAFIIFMLVVGKRLFPKILWMVASSGSRELFTLCVVAAAVAFAYGASILFDVSFALGAFFAGMMMRESEFAHRAADESLPLRDAFAVLFFVSVGMLFDPMVLIEHPVHVLLTTLVVILGKTLAAVALVLLFRYPLSTALTVGVSLAQIGEFSFILAGLGMSLGLVSDEAMSLVLAAAMLSIALNPALFVVIKPLREWVLKRSFWARKLDARDDPLAQLPLSVDQSLLKGQAVLVGYGTIGRPIAKAFDEHDVKVVIAEAQRERVDALREKGRLAVTGDAGEPVVLVQAHIMHASLLIITIKDLIKVRQMIDTARTLNPEIKILLCAQSDEEAELMRKQYDVETFLAENELANAISNRALQHWKSISH